MRSFALARNEIIPHIVDIQDFFAFICVALRNKKRGHFDLFGAENGTRTRDLNLGKVALYQLSYFRNLFPRFENCRFLRFGTANIK